MHNLMFCLIAALACLSSPLLADEREAFNRFGDYIVGGTWHGKSQDGTSSSTLLPMGVGKQFLLRIVKRHSLAVIGIDPASGDRNWWLFQEDGSVDTRNLQRNLDWQDSL